MERGHRTADVTYELNRQLCFAILPAVTLGTREKSIKKPPQKSVGSNGCTRNAETRAVEHRPRTPYPESKYCFSVLVYRLSLLNLTNDTLMVHLLIFHYLQHQIFPYRFRSQVPSHYLCSVFSYLALGRTKFSAIDFFSFFIKFIGLVPQLLY